MDRSIFRFSLSTEDALSYVLAFTGLELADRSLRVRVKDRASSTTRATLTIGAGLTVTGNDVSAAIAKADMASWPRGEYSADLVDITGEPSTIQAVRFVYDLPGNLPYGVRDRKGFVTWSENRGYVTATGAVGPPGPQGMRGETGEPGPQGETGEPGLQGETGPAGAKGDTGDAGPQGEKGDKGDQGDPGTATIVDGDKGDITTSEDGDAWEINAGAVDDAKLRDSAALSVIGRSANSSGAPADIAAATDGHVLRRSGNSVEFGETATAGIANDAVTNSKLANMANATVKGRVTPLTGDPEDLTGVQLRDGVFPAGIIVDRAYGEYTSGATMTAAIPPDATFPQITEGTQILSVSITPKSTTNRLAFRFQGSCSVSALDNITAALFVGSTANALTAHNIVLPSGQRGTIGFEFEYVPASTSALTFTVRVGPTATNLAFNPINYGGISRATLVIEEIKA